MTSESVLTVKNPTVEKYGDELSKAAPKLDSLEGKTIGLIWNGKANGDVSLWTAAEGIKELVPSVEFKFYSGSEPCPPEMITQAAEECDAFIGSTAD